MNVLHQGNSPISILGNKIQHTSGRHLGKVSCILIVYQYTTTHIHTRTSSVCRQNKLSLVQLQHSYWIYVTLSFSAAALTNHQKKSLSCSQMLVCMTKSWIWKTWTYEYFIISGSVLFCLLLKCHGIICLRRQWFIQRSVCLFVFMMFRISGNYFFIYISWNSEKSQYW